MTTTRCRHDQAGSTALFRRCIIRRSRPTIELYEWFVGFTGQRAYTIPVECGAECNASRRPVVGSTETSRTAVSATAAKRSATGSSPTAAARSSARSLGGKVMVSVCMHNVHITSFGHSELKLTKSQSMWPYSAQYQAVIRFNINHIFDHVTFGAKLMDEPGQTSMLNKHPAG